MRRRLWVFIVSLKELVQYKFYGTYQRSGIKFFVWMQIIFFQKMLCIILLHMVLFNHIRIFYQQFWALLHMVLQLKFIKLLWFHVSVTLTIIVVISVDATNPLCLYKHFLIYALNNFLETFGRLCDVDDII